jgi:hypothetical protein
MNLVEDAEVQCPYCGAVFAISVETTLGNYSMTEDCAVCCRPITFRIECEPGAVLGIDVQRA